jgi:hypothetical protein
LAVALVFLADLSRLEGHLADTSDRRTVRLGFQRPSGILSDNERRRSGEAGPGIEKAVAEHIKAKTASASVNSEALLKYLRSSTD